MKTLKENALIKGLDVSSSFYEALNLVLFKLMEIQDSDNATTIVVLLQSLDKLAEEQGLISDVVPGE